MHLYYEDGDVHYDMLTIIAMTEEYAYLLSQWKYDGIYSFYNHTEDNINEYMDGSYFACTDVNGELIGYFCYGKDARIPTIEENVYDEDFLDIGLGLRPDFCGKKHGLRFFLIGLKFAHRFFDTIHFRLSVAVFNERAIKVYKRAGFSIEREVTNSYYNNQFFIMKYNHNDTTL